MQHLTRTAERDRVRPGNEPLADDQLVRAPLQETGVAWVVGSRVQVLELAGMQR